MRLQRTDACYARARVIGVRFTRMINFKEPWEEAFNRTQLVDELEKELSKDHYLYKFLGQFRSFATSGASDDVIFEIRKMGYVYVHLTWSGKNEKTPWPTYEMLSSEAKVQSHIDSDNEDYCS